MNVCRFIATYETPPKIILQVYVALLRTFQPEADFDTATFQLEDSQRATQRRLTVEPLSLSLSLSLDVSKIYTRARPYVYS